MKIFRTANKIKCEICGKGIIEGVVKDGERICYSCSEANKDEEVKPEQDIESGKPDPENGTNTESRRSKKSRRVSD